ncbi:MAG: DUF3891 family protein [Thermoanaerobaculum sp.]|nr:DUF3891 family protein [Thermoanaerobaculum sp.]
MIVRPAPEGLWLFTQSAHALLAFQMAEHWGNRTTPRPAPRAEVLAAVLLHDAGWDARDSEPRVLSDGSLAHFARWPEEGEREQLWEDSLAAARRRARYVEYLVGHHILHLAETYSASRHAPFVQALQQRLAELAEELHRQTRYRQVFATGQDATNRGIIRTVDALALRLCLSPPHNWTLEGVPTRTGLQPLRVKKLAPNTFHLYPWPFVGNQLSLWVEGRCLPVRLPALAEELRHHWRQAPVQVLCFHLRRGGVAI